MPTHPVPHRIDWADIARGLCIVLVVTMHSTLGVELAAGERGWMHGAVAFAEPFRIPAFFLVAGLFLGRRIDRPWPEYVDTKVIHFVYFYVLWVSIQFAFKGPGMAADTGIAGALSAYALAFVQPYGVLWFIYLLPVFFVAAKLLRNVHPAAVLGFAAALELAPVATGWVVADEFAARFVYFYTGYALAPAAFALARHARTVPAIALAGLCVWALATGAAVATGLWRAPGLSLALGAAGAGAVIVIAALASRVAAGSVLRYIGEMSLVIYLAFFLPMAVARTVLLSSGIVADIGTVSLIVTAAAIAGPIIAWLAVRGTRLQFLFVRPDRAHLTPGGRLARAE